MQPTSSQQALSQLQANQATAKDPSTLLKEQNAALGVDAAGNTVKGLRTSIDNTTKLLEQVAPSVMGRTANSLVTNAQATRQIGNEQAPISANLTRLGTQYGNATTDYNQLASQAAQNANLAYTGQQSNQSYLQNLYDTMYAQEQGAAVAERQKLLDAEEIRQFNVEQSRLSDTGNTGNTGLDLSSIVSMLGGEIAPTAPKTTGEALSRIFNGYNPKTDIGFTEKVAIPELAKYLGGINQKNLTLAAGLIYKYRKSQFGE